MATPLFHRVVRNVLPGFHPAGSKPEFCRLKNGFGEEAPIWVIDLRNYIEEKEVDSIG
ncbi:MAG: hypothetical protein H6Q43_143 [Deltaproteobacteria bacterium]|nr:hypothetical protein [Deltaproteobacteria bacterium]MBP1716705.1 hypothetical protein [Deltaproteobacteria bacterium]